MFDSMLNGCEESELRIRTNVTSPAKKTLSPSSKSSHILSPRSQQKSPQDQSPHPTLNKAWSRQTSYYTQVSKTRDILPVLKDLVKSLE